MQKIKLIKQRKHPYLTDKNLVIFYLHSPTWGSYPGVNENKNKDQTMYRLYSYDILNKLLKILMPWKIMFSDSTNIPEPSFRTVL